MSNIKLKPKKTINTIKKKIKGNKDKANISNNNQDNIYSYGDEKISNSTNSLFHTVKDNAISYGNKSVIDTKDNIRKAKTKIKDINAKIVKRKNIKTVSNNLKIKSLKIKNGVLDQKQTFNLMKSQGTLNLKKNLHINKVKNKVGTIKRIGQAFFKSAKAIILGTKALITALIAGGWLVLMIIIVICLIGLLLSSVFGIFFGGEPTSKNALTITSVISECNSEFYSRLQQIQNQNPHDDYVLDGNMASWKDVLLIYAVIQTGGMYEQEVVTMDNAKRISLKQIFWDMNTLTSEVREEMVTEQGVNSLETPKEVKKRVLHITINSKTVEQMKVEYNLNPAQISQLTELSSPEYDSLWSGVIYGSANSSSGEYVNWRQYGASWSNIKIGNTNSTIADIGCLVTSVAILIEKSGISNPINPFNPGTFVEALNNNKGFDNNGNLQYNAINKVVPGFKYMGQISLQNKSPAEKYSLIKQYFDMGYYLTVEVKGATTGNQHWVAVNSVDDNNVFMIDPGSNNTNMWYAYEVSKTSKFNYFKKLI